MVDSISQRAHRLRLLLIVNISSSLNNIIQLGNALCPTFTIPSTSGDRLIVDTLASGKLQCTKCNITMGRSTSDRVSPTPRLVRFRLGAHRTPLFTTIGAPRGRPSRLFHSLNFGHA